MIVLALDIATRSGFAFGPTGGTPDFGARDFSDKAGTGAVVAKFRQWLNQRCYDQRPDLIAFEAPYVPVARVPRFRTAASQGSGTPPMNPLVLRRLLAMVGTVEAVAWELRIACHEATTQEITKFFTGTSRHGGRDAKKAAVIGMCRAFGWDVGDSDDAGDALALWAYAEHQVDPQASHRRGQRMSLRTDPLFRSAQTKSAPQSEAAARPKAQRESSPHGRTEENTLLGREIPVISGNTARKIA